MVKYSLSKNQLIEKDDDFMAQTHSAGTFDMDMIIKRMLQRSAGITNSEAIAAVTLFNETVVEIINEGNNIVTPLIHTSFSVSGVFHGSKDTFDHTRHKLNINVSKGVMLRDAQSDVPLEKTDTIAASMYVLEVKDTVSGTVNGVLTPGGIVEIYGGHIKIEGSDPACGLYFVNGEGEQAKVTSIAQNKPATLIALVPILPAGVYNVKIITQFNGSTGTKIPREYIFPHDLTVS